MNRQKWTSIGFARAILATTIKLTQENSAKKVNALEIPIAIAPTAPTLTNPCRTLTEDRFRSKNRQKWTSIGFATAILATTIKLSNSTVYTCLYLSPISIQSFVSKIYRYTRKFVYGRDSSKYPIASLVGLSEKTSGMTSK
jgi:hypothetical protein